MNLKSALPKEGFNRSPECIDIIIVDDRDNDADDDTSNDEFTSDEEGVMPLSRYTMKRPCQLKAELELQNRYSAEPIDVEGVYRRCTTACGASISQR